MRLISYYMVLLMSLVGCTNLQSSLNKDQVELASLDLSQLNPQLERSTQYAIPFASKSGLSEEKAILPPDYD